MPCRRSRCGCAACSATMKRPSRRIILIGIGSCGLTIAVLTAAFYVVLMQGIAGFAEAWKPGCGWVTDAESFAIHADVAIPTSATDMHFSGCSYGQGLVIVARFEMPKDSPDLAEFIAEVGFDQPLTSHFDHNSDFCYVYEGDGWWQPLPNEDYVGGHVVHSEALKFYDILVLSQPQADIVYVMVEIG